MAATSFSVVSLPNHKPCPKSFLPMPNLTTRVRFNLKSSPEELKIRSKTTSLARINEEQDEHVAKDEEEEDENESSSTIMMSQPEQILRLIKGLAERPLDFAVDVIAPPGTPISEAALRFFLAGVAVAALLPGGSWEWLLAKSVVCVGLVFISALLFILSSFLE